MNDYQWLRVDNNAKSAVVATTSYTEAMKHANRLGVMLKWDEDVILWTLKAIYKMYNRNSGLVRNKLNDSNKEVDYR